LFLPDSRFPCSNGRLKLKRTFESRQRSGLRKRQCGEEGAPAESTRRYLLHFVAGATTPYTSGNCSPPQHWTMPTRHLLSPDGAARTPTMRSGQGGAHAPSHQAVARHALSNGQRHALVLEDDVFFRRPWCKLAPRIAQAIASRRLYHRSTGSRWSAIASVARPGDSAADLISAAAFSSPGSHRAGD
jgi:hypothetical protein